MNEIVLSAEVISWENSLLECSEIRLRCSSIKDANQSPNYASNESRQIYSIVIGLPSEASLQELQSFFDPMKSETEDITFLFEDRSMPVEYLFSQPSLNLSQGQTKFYELRQRKVFALVKFPIEAKRNLFNALYHNMPFNSYTNCAPCIVANITNVDIRSNNELLQGKIADHFLSSLSSLKGEPISEAHEKASAVVEQSNISHSPLFIPTCSLCIRRLNTAKQLLSFNAIVSDQEIAVGRSFHCNSIVSKSQIIEDCEESSSGLLVRCIICYTYHFYQSKEATNTRSGTDNGKLDITVSKEPQIPELCSCFNCGRLESVWVCMICGFTGCSRYTQKHAECHFLASSHQFSLELASGRIWQYSLERYAHCEDSSTLYNNLIQHHTNLQFESLPTGQPPSSHPSNPPQSLHTASVNKVLVSDSYLREQDHQLVKSLHEDKVDKLDSLTSEYERMIEFQLRDQQLYYEKLLARETVRAMEYSFNLQRGKLQRHHQHLHHSYPFGSDLSSEPFFTSHMVDGGTTAGKNSANGLDFEEEADMIIDQELEEIEKIKLEISMIEVEYKKLLDHLKESEERTRLQKKTNDTILKEQKQLKLQEQEYLLKEEALRKQFSDEVQDLEQQITDLSFFLRTKKKMDASPYKEEIANGVIITGEVPLSSKKSFKSHQKKR